MQILLYILTAVLIVASLCAYFPIAHKYNLLAGVNHRSSHTKPVVTGAGFVFVVSYLVWLVEIVCLGKPVEWWMWSGLLALAVVSFVDDLTDVWFLIRLLIQFLSLAAMLWQIQLQSDIHFGFSVVQWLAALSLLVISVGTVNLCNFMDGINGMMGGVGLAMCLTFILIDTYVVDFIDVRWLYFTLIPLLIFMYLNARPQPKCFLGDVGAVVLGYVFMYAISLLLIRTGNVVYVLIFAVTYVEAGLTVAQRLLAGDNIFVSHRIHLFQLMVNEGGKPHLLISGIYTLIQLLFGMLVFFLNYFECPILWQHLICWPLFGLLAVLYLYIKRRAMGGHLLSYRKVANNEHQQP
ncbi:MAG: hypothetical protein J6Y77_07235 [Paludibacteraceae bacterium]|nr:hypothetical protein [Paludibacteraceae bacterium]